MNIKGLEALMEIGLPVLRDFKLFRTLDEIPKSLLNSEGENPIWVMRGYDHGNSSIYDDPYNEKETKAKYGFSKKDIQNVFQEIDKELALKDVSENRKLYIIAKMFGMNNVSFSGHAFKTPDSITIDFAYGNRPSKKDWKPDFLFEVPIIGGRTMFSQAKGTLFNGVSGRIVRDLKQLPDFAYVDFTALDDGYFFYHDYYQIQ